MMDIRCKTASYEATKKDSLNSSLLSIAMISVHSSPLGRLGTQDTGGMSVYIRELTRQLGLRGHRVDIFTRAGDGHTAGKSFKMHPNVRLVPVDLGPEAEVPKTALYPHLFGFYREMDRFRRQESIAYDLIHSHYWLSGQVGQKARREWGVPHLTTFHTLGALKNRLCGLESEPEVRLAVERDLAADCDGLIVTSDRERENLLRQLDADPHRIALAPCGVNLDLFRPMNRRIARERIGADMDEKLILYVGRFAPEKGLERLLRGAAGLSHLPRLRLVVVGGDGELDCAHRRMQNLSRELGLAGRVTFKGRIDQNELPWFYSAADLLALPSTYESFGMVALESLACGTPVAATRVGAMEDLLHDARNGRLALDLRPSSLSDAIKNLLKDCQAAPQPAETIRQSVLRYAWSRVAAEVLTIYRACMTGADIGHPLAARTFHPKAGKAACCGCGEFTAA
jgi:D-inositol-3-phosphate glycosyltransferase